MRQNRREGSPTALGAVVIAAAARLGIEGRGAQAEIARRCGVSEQTIGRVVWADGYMPDRDTVLGLANGLHLDPLELLAYALDLDDDEPKQQLNPIVARVDRLVRQLPEPGMKRFEIVMDATLPSFEAQVDDQRRSA